MDKTTPAIDDTAVVREKIDVRNAIEIVTSCSNI